MRIYLNENKIETEDEKHFIDVKVLNFGFKAWLSIWLIQLIIMGIILIISFLFGLFVGVAL